MSGGESAGAARPASWSSRLLDRARALGLGPVGEGPHTGTGKVSGPPGSRSGSGSPESGAPESRITGADSPVSGLLVSAGSVSARVAGFDVWLDVRVFDARQWARAEQAIAADDELCERLIDGEVPEALDGLLARAGLSLLPARESDLTVECSCPQWAACRHLAAVLGAFAAAVDADPFLLLTWRGRERDRLMLHLRELRAVSSSTPAPDAAPDDERPLAQRLDDFWNEGDRHRKLRLAERPDHAAGGAGATTRLGPSGIVIRGRSLEALLRPAYDALID